MTSTILHPGKDKTRGRDSERTHDCQRLVGRDQLAENF